MAFLKRRTFLTGAATIPFALWFDRYARAQGPLVRYDARSSQGQAMLRIYANAVGQMQSTRRYPEASPLSWTFQWYTHFVKGSTSKAAELSRVYPTPSPARTLANLTWNTCQSHSGQPEDYFLPWHRMYVYFFEQIIRKVSGNPAFTLPYWDYTASGTSYGVIPPEFTRSGDAVFGSLYVANRNAGVNAGSPIAPAGVLNLDALSQCGYSPSGALPGFNQALDFGLHGTIHVRVGTATNLGAVPYAAGDPVFWVHHCMIDRLWASWNAAGRVNPSTASYLNKTFTFADGNGNRVEAKISDFLDIARLGYSYDRLERLAPCPRPIAGLLPIPELDPGTLQKITIGQGSPLTLGTGLTRGMINLSQPLPATNRSSRTPNFAERMLVGQAPRRIFLVLRNLKTDLQPGTLYTIYLALPEGMAPEQGVEYRVGTINFFAAGHGDHSADGAGTGTERFVSFDITSLTARLGAKKLLNTTQLPISIAPLGTPSGDAQPLVGSISIIEQ